MSEPPQLPPPPAEPPIRPEFGVPPMGPAPRDMFYDPAARKRRMRLGIIGAAVGLGIPLLIVAVGVALSLTSATGSGSYDRWIGLMLVMLVGLVVAGPIQIITGIVLAAVQQTRPFGVGFLIGSAIGVIIMAGACFAPALGNSTY